MQDGSYNMIVGRQKIVLTFKSFHFYFIYFLFDNLLFSGN
jgi:hypothetical protein